MKVARVEAIPVAYPEPNDHSRKRSVCLVKITSTDGAVGWGECCAYFPEASRAAKALVDGMAELVVGESVTATHRVWHAIRHHAWWYGNGAGIASIALSGIDMALWDLKGKTLGARVLDLLGGPVNDRMPAVASLHATEADIDRMVEGMARHLEGGMQGIKVGFGKKGESNLGVDAERDIHFVRTVRQAIGPRAGFIVDVGARCRWDIPRAVYTARAFAEQRLTWLEDPFHPDNLGAFQHLRAAVPEMRIGLGERFYNVADYRRLLDSDVCDVLLIDAGRAEGVTGMWKVIQMAARHNVTVNAHSFSSAIHTAASIHLMLCAPLRMLFEMKPVVNAMHHELVTNPVAHRDGWIHAPEGHGLGVEVMEDAVARFAIRF